MLFHTHRRSSEWLNSCSVKTLRHQVHKLYFNLTCQQLHIRLFQNKSSFLFN